MQDFKKKQVLSFDLWVIYIVSALVIVILMFYEWMVALVLGVILAVSLYYSIRRERALQKDIEKYIDTISHRIRHVREEALTQMPFGIVLYNEDFKIEWVNPYVKQLKIVPDGEVGSTLDIFSDDVIRNIREDKIDMWVELDKSKYFLLLKKEERLIYLFDRTEHRNLEIRYENERPVLMTIFLDNYEDIAYSLDDTARSLLNTKVTSVINEWGNQYGLYIKRTSQERFLALGTFENLKQIEKDNFDILEAMKEIKGDKSTNVTLSIGVAYGDLTLPELGEVSQSSLDLALGRGGDQVVIRDETGKARFYGGKTNPMEKRTRVRARVISHAIIDLVKASDKVIIMGHKSPDMDSLGSAIGILNIAHTHGVEGYIIFDQDDVDSGVDRLVAAIKEDGGLWKHFINPKLAMDIVTQESLVVVVDTNKPSMVAAPQLLNKTSQKVIIDHHRRGEKFIEDPTLVYIEPYASSAAELVTELLEYQPKTVKLKKIEATALLAGITVDTKNFTLRTGSRTFDAASFLRSKGADTVLVQQFLKEDLDLYLDRSKLIERVYIYRDKIAIVAAKPDDVHGQILIAQTADTLLTMTGIDASFVISKRSDGKVGISARSLGDVNVQIIMERMNGGGHLTNAATQIEDTTVEDTEIYLKEIIDEYFEGRS